VSCHADPKEVAEWRNQRRKKFPTQQNLELQHARAEQVRLAGGLGGDGLAVCSPSPGPRKRRVEASSPPDGSQAEAEVKKARVQEGAGQSAGDAVSVGSGGSSRRDDVAGARSPRGGPAATATATAGPTPVVIASCGVFRKRGRSKFGNKCRFRHDADDVGAGVDPASAGSAGRGGSAERSKAGHSSSNRERSQPPTAANMSSLYGKLLKHEIEKEDNMILQCFRYFTQTDFAMLT
jgi:hypothetical protein